VSWRPSVDSRVCGYAVEIAGPDVAGVFTTADSSFCVGRSLLAARCSGTVTVYPLDQTGCRGLPAVAPWTYIDVYPPEDVLNIQVTDLGYNRIRVTWSPSASQDVSYYIVEMKSRGGEFGEPSASVSSTGVIISDISESISSQIRVRSADDTGNTSTGAIVDFGEDGRGSAISYCGCGTTPDNRSDGYSASGPSGLILGLACNFLTVGFGMILAAIRRFSRRKRPCIQ